MIESDEDDNTRLPSKPRYVVGKFTASSRSAQHEHNYPVTSLLFGLDPPIDYKVLAAQSARQYPDGHCFIGKPVNAPRTARRHTTVEEAPKKVQPSIERPLYRPK